MKLVTGLAASINPLCNEPCVFQGPSGCFCCRSLQDCPAGRRKALGGLGGSGVSSGHKEVPEILSQLCVCHEASFSSLGRGLGLVCDGSEESKDPSETCFWLLGNC